MKKIIWSVCLGVLTSVSVSAQTVEQSYVLPSDSKVSVSKAPTWRQFLQDLAEQAPDIESEGRYFSDFNFVGKRLDGYQAAKCLLTPQAVTALKSVQAQLKTQGYRLKTYDCYRPQMAVDQFILWAQDLKDTQMKSIFYPAVDKSRLFIDGYIAAKSGHSRGSVVDLTIVKLTTPRMSAACSLKKSCKDNSVDMGSRFDHFGIESHINNTNITAAQKQHRAILQAAMTSNGFAPLDEEWWHFRLKDEPYPKTFFNFPIQ